MRRRELIALLPALGLAACAHPVRPPALRLPALKLAPASLGASLSLAQRLTVRELPGGAGNTAERSIDVQLQVDAQALRLAAFALNQRVLMIVWDGRELQVQRHPMLPAEVDAARVLRDIQLCYWPAEAVRAALPAGWTLQDERSRRVLSNEQDPQVVIDYSAEPRWQGRAELDNRAERYRLSIESTTAA